MRATENTLEIGLTHRDVICFSLAFVLHLMLFLWKGGVLQLPNNQDNLGEMLVEVGYIADYQQNPSPALEKQSLKSCFDTISFAGLKQMMRTTLEYSVIGNRTAQDNATIDQLAGRFGEICENQTR